MNKRLIVSALTVAVTIPALALGVGVSAAQAETSDAVTETIIDSSLSGLGTEVIDPALLDQLQEDVSTAIEEGVIDPAIVDAAEELVTDPTSTPNPEETTAPAEYDLSNLIDENLDEQSTTWEEEEPAWAAAFETIRADFEACRTDGQSTSTCARTLGFQLQIAHAQAELTELDSAIAAVANLPEEEQAAALAELEAQRAELQAHLDRATAKLESAITAGTPGANADVKAKLDSVLEGVRGRSLASALPEQAKQNGQSGQQPAATTPAVPEEASQQGPSVNVDQAPGKSGNAGRPASPGSQGKGR